MCDAVSALAALSMGSTKAGNVVSAVGSIIEGEEQGQIADFNARMSEVAAGDARVRGSIEAGRFRSMGTRMIAQQRVAAGASGVEGASVEELMADTRLMSELDAQIATNNAAREAWGYGVQAEGHRMAGRAARRRGIAGAASTLLGGMAQDLSMAGRYGGGR